MFDKVVFSLLGNLLFIMETKILGLAVKMIAENKRTCMFLLYWRSYIDLGEKKFIALTIEIAKKEMTNINWCIMYKYYRFWYFHTQIDAITITCIGFVQCMLGCPVFNRSKYLAKVVKCNMYVGETQSKFNFLTFLQEHGG